MHFPILIYILYQIFDVAHGDGRIYGGYRININQAPYAVYSSYNHGDGTASGCGGTILSKNLILTAAHCTVNNITLKQYIPKRFTIRVGSTYSNSGGMTYKVKKVFTHCKYLGAKKFFHHDVGILQLSSNIKFGKTARPIQLATAKDKITVGADTVVSGWGRNYDHPNDSNHLYQIHLRVISPKKCAEGDFTDTAENYAKHEICTAFDNKSPCQGDSGGALINAKTGRQIGIVSYGSQNFNFFNKLNIQC